MQTKAAKKAISLVLSALSTVGVRGSKSMDSQGTFGADFESGPMLRFSTFASEYLDWCLSHKEPKTIERDALSLKWFCARIGTRPLGSLSLKDFENLQSERVEHVSSYSVNREFETVKHMLHKAVEWGYLEANPASRVRLLKTPPARTRFLSFEERDVLLEVCKPWSTLWSVVVTALETGMRRGELMGLTWDAISFELHTITLRKTKNGEARMIPMSDKVFRVLYALYEQKQGEVVFAKPDGAPYGNWRKAFETACRHAGLKDFRFHDLRHTFGSYLAMRGVDIRTIQTLLGHKSLEMTMRYSHISDKHLFAAVNTTGGIPSQEKSKADEWIRTTDLRFTKALLPEPKQTPDNQDGTTLSVSVAPGVSLNLKVQVELVGGNFGFASAQDSVFGGSNVDPGRKERSTESRRAVVNSTL